MVPPPAEPPAPWDADVEVCLSALEQPASPPAAAMPAAPRKPRLLRKPLLWSVTGSLSVRPAAAVLHYRAHPLTIRASDPKLGRLTKEGRKHARCRTHARPAFRSAFRILEAHPDEYIRPARGLHPGQRGRFPRPAAARQLGADPGRPGGHPDPGRLHLV